MNNNVPKTYRLGERPEILPFVPEQHARVLEIGCGQGGFWRSLNSNAEIWGIEPDQASSEEAAQKAHKVFNGFYEEAHAHLPDNYFDLVICNDVIEHMPDHDQFFQYIAEKLSPNGQLVGSIPNIRHYRTIRALLFKKDWRYEDAGILDRTHLRFFTQKSLIRCFDENNYEIIKFSGINKARFKLFVLLMNIITLGNANDMKFLQFGFSIKKRST